MVTLRRYQSDDRPAVIELWSDTWSDPASHNVPSEDIDRKLADSPDLLLVADDEGVVVGTVLAGFDGHRGWINRLAVDAAHRGQGIGRALVREAEARLSARGCHKVNLQIREGEACVVAFYESLGYRVEPRIMMGKLLG